MGVWQVCFVAAHCLCLIRQWHNMTRNNAGCQQLSSQKKKDDTLVNTHALGICVRAWLSVTTCTLEGLPSEQMALSNTSVWSIRRYSAQEVWRHILRTRPQNSHQHARKYAFTETHTRTRASGSAVCDPWLINFSPHDRDATRRHHHRCIIRQQHTHMRAHSNTNTHTIVALIKDYSLQRQRWMWLTSCPFFAGETDTRAHIHKLALLTSSLQLQHAGWMSAYGSVCIVVIVILMTDWNNSMETKGDRACVFR